MKKSDKKMFPVSVIVVMRNSETTVIKTLKSILLQKYPIAELFVIDNASNDRSVKLVEQFAEKVKRVKINLIRQTINQGVGTSYNLGVAKSVSDYVVFMHSDSELPSPSEFLRLTKPFSRDSAVIATCALTTLPQNLWFRYPFWEKCLLVGGVGKRVAGLNAKCDCHRKNTFLQIGGFDELNYARGGDIGGEDADLAMRLTKIGKVVASTAEVVHLHSLNKNYSLADWIKNRKLLARTYGRFFRFHSNDFRFGTLILISKPAIAVMAMLIPWPLGIASLFLLANVFYKKIFLTSVVWKEKEIFFLPFISVFLIYYETYWMIDGFLYLRKKNV